MDVLEPATETPLPRTRTHGVEVRLEGLVRAFGRTRALDDVSITINPGELVALLGPSGSGKTTALRVLAGLERPDSGRVVIDGEDVTRVSAHRRGIGMVFQAYSLFPTMTALENVAFGLRLRRVRRAVRSERALALLELVGLRHLAHRRPHQLSGGQAQRVALARALAIEPRVLLLDEPLSALDAAVRVRLREEIRRIQLELGTTTVFVTHDQEEALSIADRVAVLRAGRLEQLDTPTAIYHRPATPFVASFIGRANRIPATVAEHGRVVVLAREVDAPPVRGLASGTPVIALLRPESLVITPAPEGAGRILGLVFRGASVDVTVAWSSLPDPLIVTLAGEPTADLSPGARVDVVPRGSVLFVEPDQERP